MFIEHWAIVYTAEATGTDGLGEGTEPELIMNSGMATRIGTGWEACWI